MVPSPFNDHLTTYVVVITGDLYLRESAYEKANYYEGKCAPRSVYQQPPCKITENVGANLGFKLRNLENAAIRVHALTTPSGGSVLLLLTGVDAYVSSSSLPFLCNIAE